MSMKTNHNKKKHTRPPRCPPRLLSTLRALLYIMLPADVADIVGRSTGVQSVTNIRELLTSAEEQFRDFKKTRPSSNARVVEVSTLSDESIEIIIIS